MNKGIAFLLLSLFLVVSAFGKGPSDTVSYVRDIAPIIHEKCVVCHHTNGVGPFSLLNYRDVVNHMDMVESMTQKKLMPPWRADLTKNTFVNQKRLTDEEIGKIKEWVESGAGYGDTSLQEPKANFKLYHQIGKPDVVLHFSKHYQMPAGKDDIYVTYYFPLNNDSAIYVKAYEFMPDNRKIVHHSWIFLEQDTTLTKFKGKKFGDILTEQVNAFNIDDSRFYYDNLVYTPGDVPHAYPAGFAEKVKPHTVIILQIHYNNRGKAEADSSLLNIYLSQKPPKHRVQMLRLNEGYIQNLPFTIPPDSVKTYFTYLKEFPMDITLLRVSPHMHFRGKSVYAYAVTPKNDTINLISISDWDFIWQGIYTYEKPLIIPKHSKIYIYSTMDNRDSNPNNPFHPPKKSKWGVRSSDEMCQFLLYYSEYKKGDENIVIKD